MGSWQLLAESSEVAAVHAALLPNGEVVFYSGNTGPTIPAQVRVWNPATGVVRTPPNEPQTDLFCSGHALLPDGRLFVAGGTGRYSSGPNDPWGGSKAAYIFDPHSGWERVADMSFGRWYPSVICLPDGRMLVASGDDNGISSEAIEIFDPNTGAWQVLPPSANRDMPLYPRLHVLPSGEVACAGQGAATTILNLQTNEWREVWPPLVGGGSGLNEPAAAGDLDDQDDQDDHGGRMGGHAGADDHEEDEDAHGVEGHGVIVGPHHHPPGSAGPRPDDLAVLLPPAQAAKVLNAGGGNPTGTDEARVISLLDGAPQWQTIMPMHFPRWFPNSAILPDGTLLVMGGGRFYNADPVMEAEIFNPETETWTVDSTMQVPRLYHSTALLLPDGRVWVAGTDGETRMELFSPDYLAGGPRPVIFAAPVGVTYGQGFSLPVSDANSVTSACFIRLGSVTHAFNTEQRLIPLGFTVLGPNEIEVTAPADPHLAPPGHYMLFIRDGAGVPAEAPIIQLVITVPPEPPAPPEPAPVEEPILVEEPVAVEEPVLVEEVVVIEEPVAPGDPVVVEEVVVVTPLGDPGEAADPGEAPPAVPEGAGPYPGPEIVAALRSALDAGTLEDLKAQIAALADEIENRGVG